MHFSCLTNAKSIRNRFFSVCSGPSKSLGANIDTYGAHTGHLPFLSVKPEVQRFSLVIAVGLVQRKGDQYVSFPNARVAGANEYVGMPELQFAPALAMIHPVKQWPFTKLSL
jgi:hypothetical protein